MFKKDSSLVPLRLNGTYVTNRIALAFVDGEAVFGYDLTFTGVGTGTVSVSAVDAITGSLVHPVLQLPYSHGQRVHTAATWAAKELQGQADYRVRAVATASSASSASGIDVAAGASRFWVLARGAVQRTPVLANSQRFDFLQPSGGVQQFTVPDGVNEVEFEVAGSAGEDSTRSTGGGGSVVRGRMTVLPGTVYDVYAAGRPWPNGGFRSQSTSGNNGGHGGGSSDFRPAGGDHGTAVVVAAGGGGGGWYYFGSSYAPGQGGRGGLYEGEAGRMGLQPGRAATQFAGGAAWFSWPASAGGYNDGGDGTIGSNPFGGPGGGGGGGRYGGGAAGGSNNGAGGEAGDGGGGVGYVDLSQVFDLEFTDGGNPAPALGYVVFSWELPED